jgi:putative acetyltransferase
MAATSFRLRPATARDAADLARIHLEARRAAMPWLPELHSAAETVRFFAEQVLPAARVWVAEEGRVLGFCAWRQGWVDHLYVAPGSHGIGIGAALLGKAMADEAALLLWVFQRNHAAIRFYEARGFRLVDETDGAGNEEKEPDALYGWSRAEIVP